MGRKGGGLGTTLVLAVVIVLFGVGLGVALSTQSFMQRLPVLGPLFFEEEHVPRRDRSSWRVSGILTNSLPCGGPSQ